MALLYHIILNSNVAHKKTLLLIALLKKNNGILSKFLGGFVSWNAFESGDNETFNLYKSILATISNF